MTCPKCGYDIPQDMNYCPVCNISVAEEVPYFQSGDSSDLNEVQPIQQIPQVQKATAPVQQISSVQEFQPQQEQYANNTFIQPQHAPFPINPNLERSKEAKVTISVICAIFVFIFASLGLLFSTINSILSTENITSIIGNVNFSSLIKYTYIEEALGDFPIDKAEEIYEETDFNDYINENITKLLSSDLDAIYIDPDEVIDIIEDEEDEIEEILETEITEEDYTLVRSYIEDFNEQNSNKAKEDPENITEKNPFSPIPDFIPIGFFIIAGFFVGLIFLSRWNRWAAMSRTGHTLIAISLLYLSSLLLKPIILNLLSGESYQIRQFIRIILDSISGIILLHGCPILIVGIILTVVGFIMKRRRKSTL